MFPLVGYVLLFVAVGAGFIVINLLVGKLFRPVRPHEEKATIYECGEPTIGSAWVQFDLRFYVVALLFVIFDVEVAFFFPWAVVFGKANNVSAENVSAEQRTEAAYTLAPELARDRAALTRELTRLEEQGNAEQAEKKRAAITALDERVLEHADKNAEAARGMAWYALLDILVFFGVLLIGFAYLWKRGDLQWVRAVSSETARPLHRVQQGGPATQPAGTGS